MLTVAAAIHQRDTSNYRCMPVCLCSRRGAIDRFPSYGNYSRSCLQSKAKQTLTHEKKHALRSCIPDGFQPVQQALRKYRGCSRLRLDTRKEYSLLFALYTCFACSPVICPCAISCPTHPIRTRKCLKDPSVLNASGMVCYRIQKRRRTQRQASVYVHGIVYFRKIYSEPAPRPYCASRLKASFIAGYS